tara:strand:- start:42669 stop:43142 length:474 start_codon:yes stop_codon:yes gene_type:complete
MAFAKKLKAPAMAGAFLFAYICRNSTTLTTQGFSKKERLKRQKLIEDLFATGKKVKAYPMLLIFAQAQLPQDDVSIQAGVSVSKRNHKLAVTRNRIKRLIREAYRKNKAGFQTNGATFAFMFIYTGREVMPLPEMEKAMQKLVKRFNEELQPGGNLS